MAEKIDITPESSLLSHHTMHLFKYDDLDPDQFRLLKLHPQTPTEDGLLTCDLETWHRRDCPSYMALSYAWESHSGTRPIVIRGIRHLVSETVEQALQHLRRDVVQHIWVDQLCINQLNDQEKSSQVQQMRDTYQTANKVVAWLGLEFANSRLLFDHFPALEAAVQKQEWEGLAKLCANPDEVAKVKEAYAAFCDLPYWKRLWVIQEFAVAQQVTIACGSSSVDSDMVYNILTGDLRQTQEDGDMAKFYPTAWDITRRDNCTGRSFVENVIIRRSTFRSGNEDVAENQNPFITVLSVSLVLECDYNYPHTSDPRDRVFSLLNLATDTRHFSTFPDYSKTCEEVYTEAAMYFLNQGYIDALVFCQFPRKLETLPSWVPDWSMEVRWPCGQPPWTSKFSASGTLCRSKPSLSPSLVCCSCRASLSIGSKSLVKCGIPTGCGRWTLNRLSSLSTTSCGSAKSLPVSRRGRNGLKQCASRLRTVVTSLGTYTIRSWLTCNATTTRARHFSQQQRVPATSRTRGKRGVNTRTGSGSLCTASIHVVPFLEQADSWDCVLIMCRLEMRFMSFWVPRFRWCCGREVTVRIRWLGRRMSMESCTAR